MKLALETLLSAQAKSRARKAASLADGWRPGQFAFLGVDFILDSDHKPYLIEFSKAPGIRETPKFLEAQNRELVPETLDLVLAARAHWLKESAADFDVCAGAADPAAELKGALEEVRGGWRDLGA